jgi:hypothetical protein
MNEYIKHLNIPDSAFDALKKEFYDNEHKAKVFVSAPRPDGTTRSVPHMAGIRLEDAEDCVLAHKIANNLSQIINDRVKPRYYRQSAGSDLEPHVDLNATVALNVVLGGTGPVTFDKKYEYHYKAALLNVTKLHSVHTEDTRILFRLTMNGPVYEDVCSLIEGKEADIFNV